MKGCLERISVHFPHEDSGFAEGFISLIDELLVSGEHGWRLTGSVPGFYPQLGLDFDSDTAEIIADFAFSGGEIWNVRIENSSGLMWRNPYPYRLITVEMVQRRFHDMGMYWTGVDHMGFNLPWPAPGVHPNIVQLRERLRDSCLYHLYPSGEPWDFILPGDVEEIAGRKVVDYSKIRKPKFELVSFHNASTPLIQLDVSVNLRYEEFSRLFPEALNDPEFRNIWLYLEKPYQVDVCLVINETEEGDWSDYFQEHGL